MIQNLQVLRAVAAYAVVAHHALNFVALAHSDPQFSYIGIVGVDIFFVISGFIMVYVNDGRDRRTVDFWHDRIIRIIPLYWLVLFATIAVYAAGYRPTGLHQWDAKDLVTSLFLLPNVRSDGVPHPIVPVAWTLIYEMFFYFLFGLFLVFRNLVRASLTLASIFVGLSVVGLVFQPANFAVRFYTNPIVLEFAVGCLLALLYLRSTASNDSKSAAAGVILIGMGAAVLVLQQYYLGVGAKVPEPRVLFLGIPATMIVAGALALEQSGRRCMKGVPLLLGAASYAIYLVHPLVLHSTFVLFEKLLSLNSAISMTVFLISAFAAVTAAGTLVHLLVEKPLTRFLKVKPKPKLTLSELAECFRYDDKLEGAAVRRSYKSPSKR